MNATFEIKVNVDSKNVTTSIGSKGIEDLDTNLFAQILKVFGNVQKNVKAQVDKFYGIGEEQPTGGQEELSPEQAQEDSSQEQ